jgi:outer membrane cobalamin receptor
MLAVLVALLWPQWAQGRVTDDPTAGAATLAQQSASVREGKLTHPVLRKRVNLDLDRVPLTDALAETARQADVRIGFTRDVVPEGVRVSLRADQILVRDAIVRLLRGTDLDVLVLKGGNFAVVRRPMEPPVASPPEPTVGSVVGRVMDAAAGMGVSGASVLVAGTGLGAITGNTGRYTIQEVPAGSQTVVVQSLGYTEVRRAVNVADGMETSANFILEVSALPLDAIVATGTAFAARVRTMSNPINVMTAREIEAKQVTNLTDMLRGEIPGVMALSGGQYDYGTFIYVRGNSSWSVDDFLKVYIDGVEISSTRYLSTIDPKSIERIELVRGPQASAIYGSEAASGVLQIFTKKGQPGFDRARIEFQTSVGAIESQYTPSGASRPLTQDHSLALSGGTDQFSYRAQAGYVTVGEWVKNYGSEMLNLSGGLRIAQGPLTVELSALWSDKEQDYASIPAFWDLPFGACNQCGKPDYFSNILYDITQNTMGLTLNYRASDRWQHNLIMGDDQHRFGFHMPRPDLNTPADTFVRFSFAENRRRSIRYNTAYEANLGNSLTSRFTAGLDYWSYDVQGATGSNLRSAFGVVQTSANTSAGYQNDRWSNTGYFSMGEFGLEDRIFLTAAVRLDDNARLGADYGHAVSPRIGTSFVQQLGATEMKLRAQWGKGIRPPPRNARAGQVSGNSIYLPNPDIGPEEKSGWDAGVDVYWQDKASLSVTRYSEVGKNLIQRIDIDVTSTPMLYQYQNIGRVASDGWEIEGRINMGRLTLEANYAYADNVIRELSDQYPAGPNQTYQVGDRMLYMPTHSGGGALTARFWRGSANLNWSVMHEWRALDVVAYYGQLWGGDPHRGTYRDYLVHYPDALWKWNLRLQQALSESVSAFMRVDNLADNQLSDLVNTYVSPGRTTALGLRYTY